MFFLSCFFFHEDCDVVFSEVPGSQRFLLLKDVY